ncbi:CPBP family intramembrane glutamic endopeptidase [Gracilibacillus massiliensis]|uniref:CPBP family intramembrane glutamic endopeptidase n=1 Tax=Gracilibacillus massiliensis TaxID=1564956 RepID=UPI00071E58CD|nr:CPBP family intramembrane glutamic endopeptidase [Gracilibacillus massiliensis]
MKQAEIIKQLTSKQLKQQVWLSQLLLFVIALLLTYILFNDLSTFWSLFNVSIDDLLLFGVGIAIVIVAIDVLIMKMFPSKWWDDGGINQKLFQEGSYFEIISMCFVIAVSEEWLFRGVIQTNFGIIIASTIFAIIHVRYLSKMILFLSVIGLSFLLGFVYEWTNSLTVVITLHFLIDVLLAIMIRTWRFRNASKL